jgi:hypothetical protein
MVKRNPAFEDLFAQADVAGLAAGHASTPATMIVEQHASPLDDDSPVLQRWAVPDGPCGFAWIVVRPGNCPFANWLKRAGKARTAYGGGVQVSVHAFNQSLTRKEAYAHAFANVLSAAGIKAYADSRMD